MRLRQGVELVGLRLIAPDQCLAVLMEVCLRGLVAIPDMLYCSAIFLCNDENWATG